MEPENPLLDSYILSQSPNKTPKIGFIPTASGDEHEDELVFRVEGILTAIFQKRA